MASEARKRKDIKTPIGDYTRVSNNYYTGGDGQPWSMNWAGVNSKSGAGLQAGSYGNPADLNYFASAYLPSDRKVIPDYYKSYDTPIGNLEFETNYDVPNTVDVTYNPNFYKGSYSNSPLVGGGNVSGGYAGMGDYELRANAFNFPGKNPEYYAGLNFPDGTNIPNYYGETNTPLGKVTYGTNDGNPNINAGFIPNDRTNSYIQAIANLLRGR